MFLSCPVAAGRTFSVRKTGSRQERFRELVRASLRWFSSVLRLLYLSRAPISECELCKTWGYFGSGFRNRASRSRGSYGERGDVCGLQASTGCGPFTLQIILRPYPLIADVTVRPEKALEFSGREPRPGVARK
jgi:hypothetical protein